MDLQYDKACKEIAGRIRRACVLFIIPRLNVWFFSAGLRRDSLLLEGTVALISVWHSDSLLLPDVFLGEAVLPLCNIRKTVSPAVGMMNGKKLTIKMPDPCAPLLAVSCCNFLGWKSLILSLLDITRRNPKSFEITDVVVFFDRMILPRFLPRICLEQVNGKRSLITTIDWIRTRSWLVNKHRGWDVLSAVWPRYCALGSKCRNKCAASRPRQTCVHAASVSQCCCCCVASRRVCSGGC